MQTENNNFDRLPDITSVEARKRLARVITNLFDHWGIKTSEQALLLGHSPGARATLARYRKGSPLDNSMDLTGRVGHLLGIHKSLRIIFPHDIDLVYKWVTTPNRRFDGKTPLEIMTAGYEGVLAVRRYLDFERGH